MGCPLTPCPEQVGALREARRRRVPPLTNGQGSERGSHVARAAVDGTAGPERRAGSRTPHMQGETQTKACQEDHVGSTTPNPSFLIGFKGFLGGAWVA